MVRAESLFNLVAYRFAYSSPGPGSCDFTFMIGMAVFDILNYRSPCEDHCVDLQIYLAVQQPEVFPVRDCKALASLFFIVSSS